MTDTATVSDYTVTGLTCQHCVAAVTEEVCKLDGVLDVQVDLAAGRVRITSGQPLDAAAVRTAIEEAGYEVAV
jgi:copper chaperone